MKKKLLLLILSILILELQTGCSHPNELGNLSIVTGLFLEPHQEGYLLIADCADFSQQSQADHVQTTQIKIASPSLDEAVSLLKKESELPLYFLRAKVLLLGRGWSEDEKKAILKNLFDSRIVAPDISVLQTDFTLTQLLMKDQSSFGLPIEQQLKKEDNLPSCKLYQLIKNPENIFNIPMVERSENGYRFIN